MKQNDWVEYKQLFLDFKRNTEVRLDNHDKKLDKIIEFMGGLKVKLAIGSMFVAAIVSYAFTLIK